MKNTTKALLAAILSGYLIVAGTVIAANDADATIVEIRSDKDNLTTVRVEHDGIKEQIELTPEELADDDILEARLSILDDKTRETVMQALQGTRHLVDGSMDLTHFTEMAKGDIHKMVVLNSGEGHVKHVTDDLDVVVDFAGDDNTTHKIVRKHVIVDSDEHSVLRGHSDAIVRLIEKGEFTPEELDTIQAALDSKR